MATVEQMQAYEDSTVRTTDQSWVGGRKRDWDNAFMSKFTDLEATLQENDQWLALYWDSISGMQGTKKTDLAITAALKTSSAKRRTRSRIDIRDVFAGSVRSVGVGRQLSPLVSQFGSKAQSVRRLQFGSGRNVLRGVRRSSQFGTTLSMAMAQMAMIPPKSPYLTNVVADVPPMARRQQSAVSLHVAQKASDMSLRSQRSHDAGLKSKVEEVEKKNVVNKVVKDTAKGALERSNSAAAKTAAAVKRLQAISGSPAKESEPSAQDTQSSKQTASQMGTQLATPPCSANVPEPVETESPQRSARLTPAPVPTLRDMLLGHRYSPQQPAPPAHPTRSLSTASHPLNTNKVTKPDTNIDAALNSLSLEAKQELLYRAQSSTHSSEKSSPERVLAHPRTASLTSSDGEREMTRSEEDVREGLQRVKIAMARPNGGSLSVQAEAAESERIREARQRIEDIESALSDASDADLAALCRDIDSVASMLPPSADESQASESDSVDEVEAMTVRPRQHSGQRRFEDAEQVDGSEAESVEGTGKRKHSDEDAPPVVPSRLLAPTASSLARGRGKARAGPYTTGIPRQARGIVPPRSDSRLGRKLANPPKPRVGPSPTATGIRVAEARRKFESPVTAPISSGQYVSPVAAMRPGYSSIVQTPASLANGTILKRPPPGLRTAPKTAVTKTTVTKPVAKPIAKSSTAAMREAARKAALVRKPAQPQQPAQRTGNEPLFKSVAPRSSQTSIRPPSRDQIKQTKPVSGIPIPARAQASTPVAEEASASNDSGRWGLSSVLSMLSPSSWKSQSGGLDELASWKPSEPETPTAHVRGAVGSPYDVQSPQTPYEPRPEHGGGQGQRVIHAYKDVAVPLRRSSGRASTSSRVSTRESIDSVESVHHQRLGQIKNSRVSGISSIGSSFFSDDESAAGTMRKRSFGMGRTQSTPDLPQQLRAEQDMRTPALRRKPSSIRSTEYTSIIPAGSNSPPEIESDYSDEYSDEEFSPTVKRKKNDFTIPAWATTPELMRGLADQSRVNPDRIFGKVKPIRVNEIFNRREDADARRKPRNSSMIWDGNDALTADDELEYIRNMGFES
ncbi:hypothetical protein IWW43_004900 [Coemansia sp. RSA 1935]|nr:hypothetical protein J3F81_001960 [Coemansia sp. RSA 371]KAJ2293258.1 hypothetical protein IW141_001320 [Coemansia sp. RSA 355]KAJ2529443.1 hypothetical protein IWW43_004900 [Coemansia sp. RSA 1935]